MSWNLTFSLTHDEDGYPVVTVTSEFMAPDGHYSVNGHTQLWNRLTGGESIGVSTPMGSVSASITNPAKRG